jgi:nucleotide-binding universal stress UspA family protein
MTQTNPTRPRIVVGVDGSDSSKLALQWAARIAAAEAADMDVVGAWQLPTSIGWAAMSPDFTLPEDFQQAVTGTVDEVFGAERPNHLQIHCSEGDAATVLLSASHDALMLVVGSRGHGGFAGLLLGSVSAKVAEHATCPVLVVHGSA